jgi:hypothetical protein
MRWDSVFHQGELEAQGRSGEERGAESNSAMIGDKIITGALGFIRQQQMAVFSSRDAEGHRWASLLFGPVGFIDPDERLTLRFALPANQRDPRDPLWNNLQSDSHVGILLIELASRRRIRINGEATVGDNEITLHVVETFPICPKYITRRAIQVDAQAATDFNSYQDSGTLLTEALRRRLGLADVFFIGTGNSERGNDASHRGGNPGFIEVLDDHTFRIPDFRGNSLFNSIGNLLTDASVGLVIPFFEDGMQLQITATAEPLWNQPDPEGKTGGTHRFLVFHIQRWLERPLPAKITAGAPEYSHYNPS